MHPRRVKLLAGVVFFVTVVCFLRSSSFSLLPSAKSRFPYTQEHCPAKPPQPSLVPPHREGFDWRTIETHYPVQSFAQLPKRTKNSLPRIQFAFEEEESPLYHELVRKRRQAAVRAAFVRCWTSYKHRAWMKDELQPISGGSKTTFGGWGATLVDSLDTLWIMDLKDEFEEAVSAVTQIDFTPEGEVNMFETTIRYLGGLLAAYDLTDCKDSRLLEKAMELGDMIYASFDTPNRMPITRWNSVMAAKGEKQSAAANGIIAEMASFQLEFTRLSQLTGDMRYYDAVVRVSNVLEEQQNRTKIPGLWPVGIDVQTPDLTQGNLFTLGGMSDSAYEYLGKTYQLLHGGGPTGQQYKKMYTAAMNAITTHLLFRPRTPNKADILMPNSIRVEGPLLLPDHTAQHLACFAGGMLTLGGRLFDNATHVLLGKQVTDACIWSYRHAPNGIMPEVFTMQACPSLAPCEYDHGRSCRWPGFEAVGDARYGLRPEAVESVFYIYRVTGDNGYQDLAWDMFQAIDSRSRTALANAAIGDVMKLGDQLELQDSMESFWLAETLKYFYLCFAEPDVLSLDKWVFNTEAHPLRLD
ncbi:glycoside hydrolase family 47 protein [Amniculicola lignicola CBS 123094]|uniref:alpha-1,2-Mannosidase n=1 Tax=Amniculicola lignicola CBS 123094 TaxID=1392246 RepID=A0A6A5WAW6_9PLEO|nr:glycoside hydrolase family 47 protein [Amniculicola lignicola CBS 123094]